MRSLHLLALHIPTYIQNMKVGTLASLIQTQVDLDILPHHKFDWAADLTLFSILSVYRIRLHISPRNYQ